MYSKWEIMNKKYEKLEKEIQDLLLEIVHMQRTEPAFARCGSCHEVFGTEKDAAHHYLVPDQRYLNLGNCKNRYNNGVLMPPLYGYGKSLEEQAYEEDRNKWSELSWEEVEAERSKKR